MSGAWRRQLPLSTARSPCQAREVPSHDVLVPAEEGAVPTYLAVPDGGGPRPGVVVVPSTG